MGEKLVSGSDEGLLLHQPGYCTVRQVESGTAYGFDLAPRSMFEGTVRLYPSRKGWVATVYEDRRADTKKGRMTFYVQLNDHQAAWQRIEWGAGFTKRNDQSVQDAIENFLAVAERQAAQV